MEHESDSARAVEPTTARVPVELDPQSLPPAKLPSAAPSKPVRGVAFVSILVGGLCGAMIGFAFTDLQCENGCTNWAGVGAVFGALVGAVGVAIVAVLAMRAMDEWETVKDPDPQNHPSRRPSR